MCDTSRLCVSLGELCEYMCACGMYIDVKGRVAREWARAVMVVRFAFSSLDTWDQCCSFLYTHNWWHVALVRASLFGLWLYFLPSHSQFYLDLDNVSVARQLFDEHIWNRDPSNPEDQLNALGLLVRLHIRDLYAIVTL